MSESEPESAVPARPGGSWTKPAVAPPARPPPPDWVELGLARRMGIITCPACLDAEGCPEPLEVVHLLAGDADLVVGTCARCRHSWGLGRVRRLWHITGNWTLQLYIDPTVSVVPPVLAE